MDSEEEINIEKEELNKNNKNNIKANLKKVRSQYILKQILINLRKNLLIQIFRYNKNMQKKLNFTFNDYKNYKKIYSKIELEIIPAEKKIGKFINIFNKSEEIYFQIYFNNDKKCTKCNELYKINNINKIRINIEYPIKSFKELFKNCECIESITFRKFDRNNITDMSYMFDGCKSLKELNLDSFKIYKVTKTKGIFDGCSSLEKLNLPPGCKKLKLPKKLKKL